MTTGNINAVYNVNAIAPGEMKIPTTNGGNDFQNVINKLDTNTKTAKPTTTETRIDNGRVRDNVRKENINSEEVSNEKIENLANDVKDVIKDALEITDEELEEVMSELGFTIADLLVPQNVVNLIATVKGTSSVEIVTDDNLSKLLSDINDNLSKLVNQFAEDNNISFEKVVNKLSDYVAANMETESNELQKAEVKDTDSGKTIEVTIDNGHVSSENVTLDKNSTETGTDEHKSDKKDHATVSEHIVQNISDAVTNTVEQVADVAEVNRVDGVDIVRQIVDAVKVNVTEELQSLEINLNPENLGKLNLMVVAKDGVITASITAQNEAVKNAIENQVAMLKEQLNNQGLKVQEVEVTVASHGFDANMGNGENNGDTNTRSNARRRFRGIDEISDDDNLTNEVQSDLVDSNISLKA